MTQTGVYIGIAVSLLICFGLPIGGLLLLQMKYKRSIKPFLLGAAAFFLSQMLIRIPILQYVLPGFRWYLDLQVNHYYGYYIFLGLTAGLFEEAARAVFIRYFMKKERRYSDGVAFGLGHGGIEAMLLAGVSYISMLVTYSMVQTGALTAQSPGMTEALYAQVLAQYSAMTLPAVLMGGVERLLTLVLHIGFTMIVMTGIRKGKTLRYVLAAVLVHGICDASIGFWQAAGVTGYALEGVFAVYALIALGYTLYVRKDKVYKTENNLKDMQNEAKTE